MLYLTEVGILLNFSSNHKHIAKCITKHINCNMCLSNPSAICDVGRIEKKRNSVLFPFYFWVQSNIFLTNKTNRLQTISVFLILTNTATNKMKNKLRLIEGKKKENTIKFYS